MAAKQSMTQAIIQAATEATKAAIKTIREADIPVNNNRPTHAAPRSGGFALKH